MLVRDGVVYQPSRFQTHSSNEIKSPSNEDENPNSVGIIIFKNNFLAVIVYAMSPFSFITSSLQNEQSKLSLFRIVLEIVLK
jgi:hypothetical protein